MLKYILAGLAAFVLLTATLIPDDAYARRGGGGGFRGGGGGFHGGGMHAGGIHAGRIARPAHPIAGRPIAGRPGRPIAGYPGYGRGYYRPGWGLWRCRSGRSRCGGRLRLLQLRLLL
ncbi:hypothetical protein V1278_000481 [Bradyrhizobium sp. AZCC 1577]